MALYDRDYARSVEMDTTTQSRAVVGFVKQTYQYLAASMLVAAVGAYVAMPHAAQIAQFRWVLFGFVMFMLWFGFEMTRKKPVLNLIALFVFTFAMGVMIVPMLSYYIGTGRGGLIGNTFVMTAVLYASLSLFAINSKSDFSSWGKPLFITIMVAFVGGILNAIFFHSSVMGIVVSSAFLIISSGFVIYDTQNIANGAYSSPVDAAISLFVNFFNMFTSMLHLLGVFGGDD